MVKIEREQLGHISNSYSWLGPIISLLATMQGLKVGYEMTGNQPIVQAIFSGITSAIFWTMGLTGLVFSILLLTFAF